MTTRDKTSSSSVSSDGGGLARVVRLARQQAERLHWVEGVYADDPFWRSIPAAGHHETPATCRHSDCSAARAGLAPLHALEQRVFDWLICYGLHARAECLTKGCQCGLNDIKTELAALLGAAREPADD